MRFYYSLGLIILYFILTGCTNNNIFMQGPRSTKEVWMHEMQTNPDCWAEGAHPWFRLNNPQLMTIPEIPPDLLITRTYDVPYFTKLKIEGDFHVQIVEDSNQSLIMEGPEEEVKAIRVKVFEDTLCIDVKPIIVEEKKNKTKQNEKAPIKILIDTSRVMVRIGVKDLKVLNHSGTGQLEGIRMTSPHLSIISRGSGNIYLSGNMNVKRIFNFGQGCINLFGVNSPCLDIESRGKGDTNVCGIVGINSIIHHGNNNITIIGANSDCLTICADGCGKIVVSGIVNLNEVKAQGLTKVYVDRIQSNCLNVVARKCACVGLKGSACTANYYAADDATINARYVCVNSGFVKALGCSHINISANGETFTSSAGHSSIYFFGSPSLLTSFVNGEGTIIPVITEPNCCPPPVVLVKKKCVTKLLKGEG